MIRVKVRVSYLNYGFMCLWHVVYQKKPMGIVPHRVSVRVRVFKIQLHVTNCRHAVLVVACCVFGSLVQLG